MAAGSGGFEQGLAHMRFIVEANEMLTANDDERNSRLANAKEVNHAFEFPDRSM